MTDRGPIFALLLIIGATPSIASTPQKPTEASERVAIALYKGESAAAGRKADKSRLKIAVRELQILGGHPANDQEVDVVASWRTKAGGGFGKMEADPVYRGRILGPAYRSGRVAPGAPINTSQLFLAGQVASLSVAPEKGSRLGLTVTNANGAEICSSAVQAPASSCRWIPTYSERYQIRIDNLGDGPAKYFLVVN